MSDEGRVSRGPYWSRGDRRDTLGGSRRLQHRRPRGRAIEETTTMRLVTVLTERGPRACGEFEGSYVDLNFADSTLPATVKGLLALGPEGIRRAVDALPLGGWKHDPAKVTLLAPVPDPAKIVCLGLNYRDHAAESGMDVPAEPILFSKYATTL